MSYANTRNSKQVAYAKVKTTAAAERPKYWTNVVGRVIAYTGRRPDGSVYFSTSIKRMKPDGTMTRMILTVRPVDEALKEHMGDSENSIVEITEGFISFDEYVRGGVTVQQPVVVIMKGSVIDGE